MIYHTCTFIYIYILICISCSNTVAHINVNRPKEQTKKTGRSCPYRPLRKIIIKSVTTIMNGIMETEKLCSEWYMYLINYSFVSPNYFLKLGETNHKLAKTNIGIVFCYKEENEPFFDRVYKVIKYQPKLHV